MHSTLLSGHSYATDVLHVQSNLQSLWSATGKRDGGVVLKGCVGVEQGDNQGAALMIHKDLARACGNPPQVDFKQHTDSMVQKKKEAYRETR